MSRCRPRQVAEREVGQARCTRMSSRVRRCHSMSRSNMLRGYCILVLSITALLCGCARLQAQSSAAPEARITVKSVSGMHKGKCGPKRALQVGAILQQMEDDGFSMLRPCHCEESVLQDIQTNEHRLDMLSVRATGERGVYSDNVDNIVLAHSIHLPRIPWIWRPDNDRPLLELVAVRRPGANLTILWLGIGKTSSRGQYFNAVGVSGDPFGLDRGEC